jgi:hypothetical protein
MPFHSWRLALAVCNVPRRSYCVPMARWTIQTLIDEDMTVTAYCHATSCNHHQALDLVKLRARLGPDTPAMHDDLVSKLRCAKCGGKKVGLIYTPPTKPGDPYLWAR